VVVLKTREKWVKLQSCSVLFWKINIDNESRETRLRDTGATQSFLGQEVIIGRGIVTPKLKKIFVFIKK
jgi:hypothetical protein